MVGRMFGERLLTHEGADLDGKILVVEQAPAPRRGLNIRRRRQGFKDRRDRDHDRDRNADDDEKW